MYKGEIRVGQKFINNSSEWVYEVTKLLKRPTGNRVVVKVVSPRNGVNGCMDMGADETQFRGSYTPFEEEEVQVLEAIE